MAVPSTVASRWTLLAALGRFERRGHDGGRVGQDRAGGRTAAGGDEERDRREEDESKRNVCLACQQGRGDADSLSNAGRPGHGGLARDRVRCAKCACAPWCTIAVHAGGHGSWATGRTSSTGSMSTATTSRTPTATTSCRPDGSSTSCRARSCGSRRVTASRGSGRPARSGAPTCRPSRRACGRRCASSLPRWSVSMRGTLPPSRNGWTRPCAARSLRRVPSTSRAGTSWAEPQAGPSRRSLAGHSTRRCHSTSRCHSGPLPRWRHSSSVSARAGSTASS